MKRIKQELLILICSIILSSCLATNPVTEGNYSYNITKNIKPQRLEHLNKIYPKGEYKEFNNFANKIPTHEINFEKSQFNHIVSTNYQLKYDNGKRVKEPFAVSNGIELFVRVKHMKKQTENKYKGKPLDVYRGYSLAYYVNEKFLYFENEYTLDFGLGIITVRYGIIYISSTREFIVFDRNSKLESFIKENFPKLKNQYDFTEKKPDLSQIRELMCQIFDIQ